MTFRYTASTAAIMAVTATLSAVAATLTADLTPIAMATKWTGTEFASRAHARLAVVGNRRGISGWSVALGPFEGDTDGTVKEAVRQSMARLRQVDIVKLDRPTDRAAVDEIARAVLNGDPPQETSTAQLRAAGIDAVACGHVLELTPHWTESREGGVRVEGARVRLHAVLCDRAGAVLWSDEIEKVSSTRHSPRPRGTLWLPGTAAFCTLVAALTGLLIYGTRHRRRAAHIDKTVNKGGM